jgi:hypothetical protein
MRVTIARSVYEYDHLSDLQRTAYMLTVDNPIEQVNHTT